MEGKIMRTITWEDRVDITLDGGLFGLAVDYRKNEEDEKESLCVFMKEGITSKYLGTIQRLNDAVTFVISKDLLEEVGEK
jgi:hypothetical protein